MSNKLDFYLKSIKRDEEGNFIFNTGKVLQYEVSILNIYSPNILNLKSNIKTHTLMVGDSNPHSPLDMTTRQKLNK